MINNTPVCCGCTEACKTSMHGTTKASKR
jgi:hypothetical protein